MKKIFLTLAAALTLSLGLTSCGDNEDFWGLHNLTADELAEMARQDSIAAARKAMINADLVLRYDAEITMSSTSYDGTTVDIDMQQIADLFGLDMQTMCDNLDNSTGDVTPFIIESSTHADNMSGSTSGTYWGSWFDVNGDVCSWGSSAYVFAEFNGETHQMSLGQYPGNLTAGQQFTIICALKYKDKRAAVVFNITAKAKEEVNATVVGTQDINVELLANDNGDYTANPFKFDAAKAMKDIGVSSLSDATLVAAKEGGYETEMNADYGFWMGKDGYIGSWGETTASAWLSYGMEGLDADAIGVCLMPGATAAGDTYQLKFGFMNDNKIELLNVNIKVKGYEDPETPPTGTPYSVEKDVTLESTYNTDWAGASIDVKDILRDAFKMTTYQIFKAVQSGDLKGYIDHVYDTDPVYTADAPGYWLDAQGDSISYSKGLAYLLLASSQTTHELAFANHPENCPPAGQTITTKYILTCNGGKVTFNVTLKVLPAASSAKRVSRAYIKNHATRKVTRARRR